MDLSLPIANSQNIYTTQNNDPLIPNQANDNENPTSTDQPKKHSLIKKLKSLSNKNINVTSITTKHPAPSTTSQSLPPKSSHSFYHSSTMKPPTHLTSKLRHPKTTKKMYIKNRKLEPALVQTIASIQISTKG